MGLVQILINQEYELTFMSDNKKEETYIKFVLDELLSANRKTQVWAIVTTDDRFTLGYIKWYPNWRGYAFFPAAATIFEPNCLRKMIEFIERQNKNHREQLKNEKA